MPPSLPEVIGKYTVERFIESGGMGDVYLARDPALDRQVAIKFLREGFDNEEMRERFEREARAAGRLSHPNIVTIYEFGEFDRRPFIAMEFVRGEPLSKLIRRRESIPLVRKLEMMEGLCAGLGHAHKAGIVHRDIKPANLMVDLDGPLKILDFGIVRMAGSGLTSHGVLVGTINYMSPEQIAGSAAIDHRSDVFAVGSVLHEIFTYQRAFPGEMTDVLYKIVHAQPESAAVLVPGLDPGIVRAIDVCLQKAPDRRYQDLNVLRRDLARIRQRLEVEEFEHGPTAVTPAAPPSLPPSLPKTPPPPPGPSAAERARRAEEAAAADAAARARVEEQQRQERARAEKERADKERADKERAERLRAEQAEQARQEQARQEQRRQEQARQEHARQEQARAEAARAEEARQAKLRADEAARALAERERAQQAQLADARKAREEADRKRAEEQRRAREEAERQQALDQQRAREEAERQAAARREQRQRDLAEGTQLVAAGRFADAVQRLTPWIAESANDASFNGVLREARAGVEKLEADKKAREALQREVAAAADLLVRQDLNAASRAVQAILKAHPGHPPAKNLEREIVMAVEVRAKADSAVQRARAMFDAQPGDAMTLLERFTPPHSLVDGALKELRATYAAREQARQKQEREARRREAMARVRGQVRSLAESRGVQAGAALLVLVLAVLLWRGFSPSPSPSPDPVGGGPVAGSVAGPAGPTGGTPAAGGEAAPKTGVDAHRPSEAAPVNPKPTGLGGTTPKVPKVETPAGGNRDKEPVAEVRPRDTGSPANPGGTAAGTGGESARPDAGRPAGPTRDGTNAGNAALPNGGPEAAKDTQPPADPGPRRDPQPTQPDPTMVARAEINRWMAAYMDAYVALDARRVRELNRQATLAAGMLKSARVSFSNVTIDPKPDGQSATLRATVTYTYEWTRSGLPPQSSTNVQWPMTKVGASWVAN